MRARGAPESRGCSWAGRIAGGTLTLLALAIASPPREPWSAQAAALRQLTAGPKPERPGFTLPDTAGTPLMLAGLRGRVVLVHFFATWCEACRDELASLSRLVRETHGKRIAVVAVSVAEVPLRVRRFLDATPVSFPVVLDADRSVARAWGVDILPTTFVLDPALRPRLLVEGDLDWSRADVLSTLDAIAAPETSSTTNARPQ